GFFVHALVTDAGRIAAVDHTETQINAALGRHQHHRHVHETKRNVAFPDWTRHLGCSKNAQFGRTEDKSERPGCTRLYAKAPAFSRKRAASKASNRNATMTRPADAR